MAGIGCTYSSCQWHWEGMNHVVEGVEAKVEGEDEEEEEEMELRMT